MPLADCQALRAARDAALFGINAVRIHCRNRGIHGRLWAALRVSARTRARHTGRVVGPEFDNRIFLKIKVLARGQGRLDLAISTAILDFSRVVMAVIRVTDKGSFCEAISADILMLPHARWLDRN